MVLRRFNYTNRKRLTYIGDDAHFKAYLNRSKNRETTLMLEFNKDKMDFWQNENLFLEWRYNSIFRFKNLGPISNIEKFHHIDDLGDIDPELIKIAVKVVNLDGKILAKADKIQPESDDDTEEDNEKNKKKYKQINESFFIWKVAELGHTMYQMEIVSHRRPTILLNKDLRLINLLTNNYRYQAFLFPSLLRELLIRYLTDEDLFSCSVREKLMENFTKISKCFFDYNDEKSSSYQEKIAWVDTVIDAFSFENKFKNHILKELNNDKN